nr:MAG TPA: hypothetical protein [Caudoviricetes sp.]
MLHLQKISYARQIESPLSLLSLALFLAENKLRSANRKSPFFALACIILGRK